MPLSWSPHGWRAFARIYSVQSRALTFFRILPNFVSSQEFTMIHHFARALAVREQAPRPLPQEPFWSQDSAHGPATTEDKGQRRPIRPRPLTPWQVRPVPGGASDTPSSPNERPTEDSAHLSGHRASACGVRICTDPADARRTVIAGRFAAVCAALDRLVREQEALA